MLAGGRAIVAGHAFGHDVARVTDLDHPQLVRGVVVIAGAARNITGASHALVPEQPAALVEAIVAWVRDALAGT